MRPLRARFAIQLRIIIGSALNRPVDDWGKLLGDTAAVTALLDRLLHHAHVLKCGPRSWRTKVHTDLRPEEPSK
jgi:DNA replication protein DnaC